MSHTKGLNPTVFLKGLGGLKLNGNTKELEHQGGGNEEAKTLWLTRRLAPSFPETEGKGVTGMRIKP